jgi:hypothetical protein
MTRYQDTTQMPTPSSTTASVASRMIGSWNTPLRAGSAIECSAWTRSSRNPIPIGSHGKRGAAAPPAIEDPAAGRDPADPDDRIGAGEDTAMPLTLPEPRTPDAPVLV